MIAKYSKMKFANSKQILTANERNSHAKIPEYLHFPVLPTELKKTKRAVTNGALYTHASLAAVIKYR